MGAPRLESAIPRVLLSVRSWVFLLCVAGGAGQVLSAPKLNAPTSLNATAVSISQINLTWTDTNKTEKGYRIKRSLSSGSGFSRASSHSASFAASSAFISNAPCSAVSRP